MSSLIRDWVLVPIVLIMFLVGLLRHYITKTIKGEQKVDVGALKLGQMMARTSWFIQNSNEINDSAFAMRKAYFNDATTGVLKQKKEGGEQPPQLPMQDPSMMMEMMKNNLTMIVTQMGMMGVMSSFFSGFIVVKLPFPLSAGFRGMLQRGVELNALDVTYVSSMSWYFVNLFGMSGLFSLILGDDNETDDTKLMQSQMSGQAMGAPGQDNSKVMLQQAENIEVVNHEYALVHAERTLLTTMNANLTAREKEIMRSL